MAATKTAYFEPSLSRLRDRLLTQIAAGEKPELTANQWTPVTVGRLGAAVTSPKPRSTPPRITPRICTPPPCARW